MNINEIQDKYSTCRQLYDNKEYIKAAEEFKKLYNDVIKVEHKLETVIQILGNVSTCYKDYYYNINMDEKYLQESLQILFDIILNTYCEQYKDLYKGIISNHTQICNELANMKSQSKYLYQALNFDTTNYILYYNLGVIHRKSGDLLAAALSFKQSIICNPKHSSSYCELSLTYRAMNNYKYSWMSLEQGIARIPNDPYILNEMAIIDLYNNRYIDCEKKLKTALNRIDNTTINPKKIRSDIYLNLGCMEASKGFVTSSCNYFDKSYKTYGEIRAFQNMLLNSNYEIGSPFDNHKNVQSVFDDMIKSCKITKRDTIYNNGNPLNIGYVSGDFENHAVSYFSHSMLSMHDISKFKVYGYSTKHVSQETIKKFKNVTFVVISKLPQNEIYNIIKDHNIHILIDLAGHTADNNLLVFASKPAPIQITYIGYPNTTGISQIDYKIVDKISDHIDTKQYYSEKLLRWDRPFLDYTPPVNYPNIKERQKRKAGKFIYGSTNRGAKLTPELLKSWKSILELCENNGVDVELWIKTRSPIDIKIFGEYSSKVKMCEYLTSYNEHLEWYNNIDVALDSFPYSSTTGACEGLLMGTPVLTLSNKDIHASNVSASILTSLQLSDYICDSLESYIHKAYNLSEEYNLTLKSSIRNKFLSSSITDHQQFINVYENTLSSVFSDLLKSKCV